LHGSNKSILVSSHLPGERLILRLFVLGGPEDHFGEDGSEIKALGGQNVNQPSAIGEIFFRGDYAMSNQSLQPTGQYIGGDPFVGCEEFFEGAETSQHHVA
jgi:hypothetical protein